MCPSKCTFKIPILNGLDTLVVKPSEERISIRLLSPLFPPKAPPEGAVLAAAMGKRKPRQNDDGLSCCGQHLKVLMNSATMLPFSQNQRRKRGGPSYTADSRSFRLARKMGRFAPLPAVDAGLAAEQQAYVQRSQQHVFAAQNRILACKQYMQYVPYFARLETFILHKFEGTFAALRLLLVSHLGSDFSKSLDELYAEFFVEPGVADLWRQLAPAGEPQPDQVPSALMFPWIRFFFFAHPAALADLFCF
jgi:hypothetical protein